MVLLRGKTRVDCPRDKKEVSVSRDCAACPDFKHLSLESYTVLVTCSYLEQEQEKSE